MKAASHSVLLWVVCALVSGYAPLHAQRAASVGRIMAGIHGAGRNGGETTERTCAISSVTIFRIARLDGGLRARQSSSDEHETVSLHKGEWA